MIEDPRHRIFVVKMSAQLAKITDLQSADTGIAPCCQFTVPVLADDIGMHASAVHIQMLAKLIPESSGIQNGSGADDAVRVIARFLQRNMGQDIHRVGNDQQKMPSKSRFLISPMMDRMIFAFFWIRSSRVSSGFRFAPL